MARSARGGAPVSAKRSGACAVQLAAKLLLRGVERQHDEVLLELRVWFAAVSQTIGRGKCGVA